MVPAVQSEQDQEESEGEDSALIMDRLCKFIYAKDRTDRIRTCAILCHIYHHALHSRWYQARDLMLMSHLQDNIHHADPPVQVGWQAALKPHKRTTVSLILILTTDFCLLDPVQQNHGPTRYLCV